MTAQGLSPTSAVVAVTATTSAARYAADVHAAVRGNVAYLLASVGGDPAARAWAAVEVLAGVACSAVAANAHGDGGRR